MTLVVGTRGSALALAQARLVARALGPDIELRVVRTQGDGSSLPLTELGDGIFVDELEQALRRGAIDAAVHSLKDLPTAPREDLVIAAIPTRDDPRDVLLTATRRGLHSLPKGARVGTGSPRRGAFLLALRPDLEVADIRGNVDTRVRKLMAGEYDAIVLALAGLHRIQFDVHDHEVLSLDDMPPAAGQAALAVQCRADDEATIGQLAAIEDRDARTTTAAERALLRALGGSCSIPLGAHARMVDGEIALHGALARDGILRVHTRGREPIAVGERAAAQLRQLAYV